MSITTLFRYWKLKNFKGNPKKISWFVPQLKPNDDWRSSEKKDNIIKVKKIGKKNFLVQKKKKKLFYWKEQKRKRWRFPETPIKIFFFFTLTSSFFLFRQLSFLFLLGLFIFTIFDMLLNKKEGKCRHLTFLFYFTGGIVSLFPLSLCAAEEH